MKTLLGLGFALVLVACSDDDKPKPDTGVTLPDGSGVQDTGGVIPDKGVTQQDTGVTTSSNSGKTCSQTAGGCPSTEELCIMLTGVPDWPAGAGICGGECNKGTNCPVPDPSKHLSYCMASADQITWYCLFLCEGGGKTYECPDPATQVCVPNPQQADIKLCAPKGATPTTDGGA